jgi:hypothetical protein
MTADLITVKIPVRKKGELNFFQVSIPQDVHSITGIQTGVLGITAPQLKLAGKTAIGSLRLQAEQLADLCFLTDISLGTGALENTLTGFDHARQDIANLFRFPFANGNFGGVEQVMIRGALTLYGCYQDQLGKDQKKNISYTIGLYLWTKSGKR